MSRYTGPRVKVMRALGVDLPGLSRKKIERRPYPPGQHGQQRARKQSDYGRRLQEKKKLCMNYGVTEGQLRRTMRAARRSSGPTGEALLVLLERRLDSVVFRAGFARTIPAARQLVCHGHICVDGKRLDIPSYLVRAGQVLSVTDHAGVHRLVDESLATRPFETAWLTVAAAERSARVATLPDAASVLFPIEAQLVVEFYSQKL